MGNFQSKSALLDTQVGSLASSTTNADVWLDKVIAALAAGAIAPWHVEEIRPRLKDTPFGAILSVIERAGPYLDRRTAIALYEQWINANDGTSPMLYVAWFNIGVLFADASDHANATIAYGNALALRPDLHDAAINLGLLLEASGRPDEALAVWQRTIQSDAARVALEIQGGRLLENLGRFDDAERMLRRVLLTDPVQPDVVHHWVHIRQKICQWPVTTSDIPGLSAAELLRGSGPLGILALTDDISLQRDAAAAWISRKTKAAPRRLAPVRPYLHERIRLGYMSSDFCSHAMSYLITELFERHDRRRFEIFGYCSSQNDDSHLRKRVLAAFDHHRIIRTLSDEQAAQIIRDDEIDVLIDLNGITEGSRLPVLRWRPAPIQATYLGFIGPIPLPELDYLVCDNVVIPPEYEAAYQPTPLPLPRLYQANDSKRAIGRRLSRAEVGLPEDCFVLCCFSKHYKITEEIFSAWMSILRQTSRAVLWLAMDNASSQANLLAAARSAGVAEERLIFSERVAPDLYMSRLALANLFLDTFPYNAGTVASDAIRMGVPLVTLCGQAFASRMAASLLHAMGARQGITTSLENYVATSVRLVTDPREYNRYKALFTEQAWSHTIGDIGRFSAEFEDTWYRLVAVMRDSAKQPNSMTNGTGMNAIVQSVESEPRDQTVGQREGEHIPFLERVDGLTAAYQNKQRVSAAVLHVGCGVYDRSKLPPLFRQPGWREIRLDIDPDVRPDLVASIIDMGIISDGLVDAVYSSHNIEHLYPHEVPLALQEMRRVLKPTGFTFIRLPDLQEVARHVIEDRLEDPLYISPMGPISPLDILYGHRPSLASGNVFMAHRTGFTGGTLGSSLIKAGFAAAVVQRDSSAYCLTAIAFRSRPREEELAGAQAQMAADRPAVLYTATA
jgi:predicted O-linked N-acetylglucosamine transferase (SPINDLY family)